MSRYNTKSAGKTATVKTHQGGVGYKYDAKTELIALLATGLDNKFYENENERSKRFAEVLGEVASKDSVFAAKALVYARTVMGQRTVTHRGAVELAKYLSGSELGTRFYSKRDRKENKGGIIFRLDDMLEIAACYMALNPGKALSNAIRRGFKLALESADAYELAKYQAKNKELKLVDIVNLVRPKPTKEMEPVFAKLMKGELKQFNTVEDKNTEAGKVVAEKVKAGVITKAEAEAELNEAKTDNYAELIRTRKIGYLALIRNLRNILKSGANTELVNMACELLVDETLIKNSLVFPHQIDLALEIMLDEFSASQMGKFAVALNKAYELAIPNLTELFTHGTTAIVYDGSGSMTSRISINGKRSRESAITKAALIAATLAKATNADVYCFDNSCFKVGYNPLDSVNTLKNHFAKNSHGGGTEFNSIFRTLDKAYDRVIVLSDMQGADSLTRGSSLQAYKSKYGIDPYIYSVDLCGYGTTMFNPKNSKTVSIFGYSADIYEYIKKAEIDPKAIIKEIEAIVI